MSSSVGYWKRNKRRRLEASADVPHEVTVGESSQHSPAVYSPGQSIASLSDVIVLPQVNNPLSCTPTGTLTSGTLATLSSGTLTSAPLATLSSGTLSSGTLTSATFATLSSGTLTSATHATLSSGTLTSAPLATLSSGTLTSGTLTSGTLATLSSGTLTSAPLATLSSGTLSSGTLTSATLATLSSGTLTSATHATLSSGTLTSATHATLSSGTLTSATHATLSSGTLTSATHATLSSGTLTSATHATLSSGTLTSATHATLSSGTLTSEINNPSEVNYSVHKGNNENPCIPDIAANASSRDIDSHVPVDNDLLGAINSNAFRKAVVLLTSDNTFTQDELNQALLSACRRGHKLLVQTLVRVGANIEHRDEHGNTPLLICARNGFTDIVRFLVSRHANTKAVNFVGNTALILSVSPVGSTDLTRFLVEHRDVDIHHENNNGFTALSRAILFMDVDMIKLLLQKSVRRTTNMGYRPDCVVQCVLDSSFFDSKSQKFKDTVIAKKTGLLDVFIILMGHLITGTSPLELAIKADDIKSLDIFLDCQFSSGEEKKRYIDNALMNLFEKSRHKSMERFSSTDIQILKRLLKYGADVNQGYGPKLISLAVKSGNFQVVELLCTHGADMKRHYSGEDPLVIATKLGRPDLIELLLKYKADIDGTDFTDSALDYALRNDHTECAKLLIQRGAKMDVKSALRSAIDHQMSKYLHFLFENYNLEIMDYFSQQPQEVRKLLTLAAEKGNCEIIGQILDAGVDINKADSTGQSPLMASKNRDVAEYLIQRGADVNLEIEGRNGSDTVLSHVIKKRKCKDKSTVDLCKVLIENGASVNCRSGEGETPLMMAAAQDGCVEMLHMLLDNGADVNDTDNEGNTALFHAVRREYFKHVKCLIDCSRDKTNLINIQNKKGITPLILSVQDRNVHIVKELKENGADVNIKDNRENTALHHLLIGHVWHMREIEEILTSLLKAGSHVNWQNSDGLSPLMIAAKETMPSVMSSLLDAGADVNAVSKNNNSQTALSFISDSFIFNSDLNLGNNVRSCMEQLLDGGACGSYLCSEFIHKLIIGNHINIILKLIHHGVGPAEVDKYLINIRWSGASSTVSPLCLALLLGKVHLARHFVDILFLTRPDLSMFATNKAVECLLQRVHQEDSLRFLHEISSQPMSLVKLSLVTVSVAVGSSPGRETRVDSLPLPQIIKDKLLFKSVGSEHAALAETSSKWNTLSDHFYESDSSDSDLDIYYVDYDTD